MKRVTRNAPSGAFFSMYKCINTSDVYLLHQQIPTNNVSIIEMYKYINTFCRILRENELTTSFTSHSTRRAPFAPDRAERRFLCGL